MANTNAEYFTNLFEECKAQKSELIEELSILQKALDHQRERDLPYGTDRHGERDKG